MYCSLEGLTSLVESEDEIWRRNDGTGERDRTCAHGNCRDSWTACKLSCLVFTETGSILYVIVAFFMC